MLNLVHMNHHQTLFLAVLIAQHYREQGEEAILVIEPESKDDLIRAGLNYPEDFLTTADCCEIKSSPINFIFRQHPVCVKYADRVIKTLLNEDIHISTYEDGFAIGHLAPDRYQRLVKNNDVTERHCLSFDRLEPLPCPNKLATKMVSSKHVSEIQTAYPGLFTEAKKVMNAINSANVDGVTIVATRPLGSKTFHRGRYASKHPERALLHMTRDLFEFTSSNNSMILYREDKRDKPLTESVIRRLRQNSPHLSMELDSFLNDTYGFDAFLLLIAESEIEASIISLSTSFPLIYTRVAHNTEFIIGVDLSKIDNYRLANDSKKYFLEVDSRMWRHLDQLESVNYRLDRPSEGVIRMRFPELTNICGHN